MKQNNNNNLSNIFFILIIIAVGITTAKGQPIVDPINVPSLCDGSSLNSYTPAINENGETISNECWQIETGVYSGTYTNITASYPITSSDNNKKIRYCVTYNIDDTICSNEVTLMVNTAPTAPTGITGTTAICSGSSTTLTADGGSAGSGCTYQWYSGSCGGTLVSGSGASVTVSPTTNTTYYVRRVGNTGCTNTTSCASVIVTVDPTPTAPTTVTASPNTICSGSTTTLSASGGTGSTTSYQWATSCGGTTLSINSSYTTGSLTSTATYYVRRYGTGACSAILSPCASVTVTVNTAPTTPTGITGTTNICSGSSTILTADGGSTGSGCTYQWYSGSCGGTVVSGSGTSITVNPSTTTTYYVRRVGNTGCTNTTSCASVTVTVNNQSTAPTLQASETELCESSSITLTASGGTSGTNSQYEWGTGSTCGSTVFTTTSIGTITDIPPVGTTIYWVRRKDPAPCSTTTDCAYVTVTVSAPATAVTSITATQNPICLGSSTTLSANGATNVGSYKWFSGSCPSGTILQGSGADITVTPSVTTNYYVQAIGSENCSSKASDCSPTVTLIVNEPSTITLTTGTQNQTVCAGTAITTTVYTFGGSATSAFVNYLPAGLTSNVNPTAKTVTISGTPSANGTYTITTNGHVSPCTEVTISGEITVNPLPIVSITSTTTATCIGGNITMEATPIGGNWTSGTTATATIDPSTGELTPKSAGTTVITYSYTDANTCTNTDTKTITVNEPSTITLGAGTQNQTVCAGTAIEQTIYKLGGSATDAFVNNLPAGLTSDVNTTAKTVTISGTPSASGTYTIKTSGHVSPCTAVTITGTITVNPLPTVSIAGQDSVCANQKDLIYIATSPDDVTYEWSIKNGDKIKLSELGDSVSVNWHKVITANEESISVTVTDNNSTCAYTDSFLVSISKDVAPELNDIIAKKDQNGKLYILIYPRAASDDFNYQWYKDGLKIDGATEQFYYPGHYNQPDMKKGDEYKVSVAYKISKDKECKNFTANYIFPEQKFTEPAKYFTVSPNPANSGYAITVSFNRELLKEGQNYLLCLHSVTGEKIWEQKINSLDDINIVKTMITGTYTFTLIDNKQKYSEKIIVK